MVFKLPPPGQPAVDSKTGKWTDAWYRIFEDLQPTVNSTTLAAAVSSIETAFLGPVQRLYVDTTVATPTSTTVATSVSGLAQAITGTSGNLVRVTGSVQLTLNGCGTTFTGVTLDLRNGGTAVQTRDISRQSTLGLRLTGHSVDFLFQEAASSAATTYDIAIRATSVVGVASHTVNLSSGPSALMIEEFQSS